ncbi:MAG: glutamine amidotransferase [Thermoleophilia bacterium]|nr:glutamine amidotransferase [Thermoleophilia bacterium]
MCRLAAFIGDLRAASGELRAFEQLAVHNGDGFGIGGFVDGRALVRKSPVTALDNPEFTLADFGDANSAIVHLRKATVGGVDTRNTHPFDMGDRIVAHNGSIGDRDALDRALGLDLERLGVAGETDSERFAALLHQKTLEAGGDTVLGYQLAAHHLAEHNPMTSLTSVTTTADGDLFALRYPENRSIFWKRMGARDAEAGQRLLVPGERGGVTVLASRPLDAEAGWVELMPGELLHVRAGDLHETVIKVIDEEPIRRFTDAFVDEGASWTGPRRHQLVEAALGG